MVEIQKALEAALCISFEKTSTCDSKGEFHRNRSRNFVEALADEFKKHYKNSSSVRVLSKHCPDNEKDFGLSELLFDVLVCDTEKVPSAAGRDDLTFVKRGIWAVESELARDSKQAIYDFNKLVLAAADFKLFVGPFIALEKEYLGSLLEPAKYCTGRVFVALVPHPSEWKAGKMQVKLLELSGGEWK